MSVTPCQCDGHHGLVEHLEREYLGPREFALLLCGRGVARLGQVLLKLRHERRAWPSVAEVRGDAWSDPRSHPRYSATVFYSARRGRIL